MVAFGSFCGSCAVVPVFVVPLFAQPLRMMLHIRVFWCTSLGMDNLMLVFLCLRKSHVNILEYLPLLNIKCPWSLSM
jgi:hypothetical protein